MTSENIDSSIAHNSVHTLVISYRYTGASLGFSQDRYKVRMTYTPSIVNPNFDVEKMIVSNDRFAHPSVYELMKTN